MASDQIPTTVPELTPTWLSEILTASGDATGPVTAVEPEILGEGAGFIGTIARLRLDYGEHGTGPASIIAKLPTDVDENRMVGEATGSYEREIRVYRELASRIPAPMPRCLHAEFDERAGAERLPGLLRFFDRRRPAIVDGAVKFTEWMGRKSRRRYVLLMEDLAPALVGNQVAGCTPEEAATVLEAIAPTHAEFWGARAPAEAHWILPGDIATNLFQRVFLRNRESFEATFADVLDDHARALLEHLEHHGAEVQRAAHHMAPPTLLHGDLRLDNLFLEDGGVRAFVDWQAVGIGPAASDVTYFLSGSLRSDTPAASIDEILHRYHAVLTDHGVTGYPIYRLRADYDRALLVMLHRLVGIESIEFGDARGVDLTRGWVQRVVAHLADVGP